MGMLGSFSSWLPEPSQAPLSRQIAAMTTMAETSHERDTLSFIAAASPCLVAHG